MSDFTVLAIVGIEQFSDYAKVARVCDSYAARMSITAQLIISGESPGPNQMAKDYAIDKGIKYQLYPIDWENDGKGAAYRRDDKIIEAATHLVIIHDGADVRMTDFINKALAARKNVLRINVERTTDTYVSKN